MKKIKLTDLYQLKIFSNSFSFLELLIYIIFLILQFFLKLEDKLLMIKYTLMILDILLFSNIITIKLKNFDLFFVNDKRLVIFTYIKIFLKESVKYGLIIGLIFSIKEELLINNILVLIIYSMVLISTYLFIYILFSNSKANILIILFIFVYVFSSNYLNNSLLNYIIFNFYYLDNYLYLNSSFIFNLLILLFNYFMFYFIFSRKNIII